MASNMCERKEPTSSCHRCKEAKSFARSSALGGSWREVFSLDRAVRERAGIGMPGREPVAAELAAMKARIAKQEG